MPLTLPILTFHDIADRSSVISFSPQIFRRGIARLHESGYRTLSLLEAVDCLRRRATFPNRSFVITFDDGYQSVYEEAVPVLQCYGMSATVFLTVGENKTAKTQECLPSLEGRSMLSWHEIREMQRAGITFGAHTLTHPDLTRLPLERLRAEVCDSKAVIEDALGASIDCFAYPFGRYDHRSYELALQHFSCACSDKLGLITAGSDPYTLERVDSYYLRTERLFALTVSKLLPWYIQARSIPRRVRRAFQRGLT
jgi:peptidoglycan/xylan/chitin deacetylase (PgdA/CDA1 family)